jgi:hypothetical protein
MRMAASLAVVMVSVMFGVVGNAGAASMNSANGGSVAPTYFGCDDKGAPALCPKVALVSPPSVVKRGAIITFQGRVADPSKDFRYRISVTRGGIGQSEEITTTYHAHKAVVYPTRRWTADRQGRYTVCVVGTHTGPPHPVAHDCRTFVVR